MSVNPKCALFIITAAALASGCWVRNAYAQSPAQRRCFNDQIATPTSEIANNDFVELEDKSPCSLLPCQNYSVRLQADGTVIWNGKPGARIEGAATPQVSPAAARALIESYRAEDFWSLCERGFGAADGPEVVVTLHIGDQEKSVHTGTPDWALYRKVTELAGTYYWIRGDPQPESLDDLVRTDSDSAPKPAFTDLMRDALRRDLRGVQRELAAGANVNAQDSSGFTTLMCAALRRDPEVIAILLKAGADPNLRTQRGQTALMAASAGWAALSEETFRVLIAAGANLNTQDSVGQSALMLAARDRDGQSAMMLAAPQADATLISFLLTAGAKPDVHDTAGHTALDLVSSALAILEREADVSQELRRRRLQQVREVLLRP